jgi:hypothetical protein
MRENTIGAEKGLILVRVFMTVIYVHVIHSLRRATAHRQQATLTEPLSATFAKPFLLSGTSTHSKRRPDRDKPSRPSVTVQVGMRKKRTVAAVLARGERDAIS